MENVLEITPEAQEVVKKADHISNQLANFKITTNIEYAKSGEYLKSIKQTTDELDTLRKSMTKPLDDSKKKIMDFFRKPLDILAQAESTLKRAMLSFQQEQDRIRREQEAKLQAEAEKKRQEALRKAEEARAQGKDTKAEKYEEKANGIVAPVLASTVEKVSGIATKTIWKHRIIDISQVPREYLIINDKMVGDVARATKGSLKVAGIEFYSEEVISAGRA